MRSTDVLVIDHSALFLAVLRYFLQMCAGGRFTVETATSLAHAHADLPWFHPDVVLLDVKTARTRGVDSIVQLKQLFPDAGIIALSRLDDNRVRTAVINAGADAYLAKAYLHTGLLPTMFAVLRRRGYSVLANIDRRALGVAQ